jgi:hypothetical protein
MTVATESRPASQVPLEVSEEAGHGGMVMLSLLVLPLPMLHSGCDTLLTHQLLLMQLSSPGHPMVSPQANIFPVTLFDHVLCPTPLCAVCGLCSPVLELTQLVDHAAGIYLWLGLRVLRVGCSHCCS